MSTCELITGTSGPDLDFSPMPSRALPPRRRIKARPAEAWKASGREVESACQYSVIKARFDPLVLMHLIESGTLLTS